MEISHRGSNVQIAQSGWIIRISATIEWFRKADKAIWKPRWLSIPLIEIYSRGEGEANPHPQSEVFPSGYSTWKRRERLPSL